MVALDELVRYCDGLLEAGRFRDYSPNGLQVEGRAEVRRLVTGVSASLALLEEAAARGADAVLVHHGWFWRGEDPRVVGMRRRRLARVLEAGMSLIAYHLPLDAHPELGNNAQLARRLGFVVEGRFGRGAEEPPIGMHGRVEEPLAAEALARRIAERLGREPLHVAGGPPEVRTIAWCSGAAQGWIEAAADLGVDAYLTGEVSEPTVHVARERGLHFFAAGHHATERDGVRALGEHLAARFGLEHEFVDVPNPA